MILSKYKAGRGYIAICKCDSCGIEFNISYAKVIKQKQHFCSKDCLHHPRYCIMCHKPYNDTFYDKGFLGKCDNGGDRFLCSRECYSDWFDKWLLEVTLDNEQKAYQRKRTLAYYYEHQNEYKTKYKNRYHTNKIGLAGAI